MIKIIFKTSGLLSIKQISVIVNLIAPKNMINHQQTHNKLVLYMEFEDRKSVTKEFINNKIKDITYAECIEVN